MKRVLLVVALVAVLALPFALRPRQGAAPRTDDVVIVITSHNEAIRHEFGEGFVRWYRRQTGRSVTVDWRVIGGTSEISRLLAGNYTAAFQLYWTRTLGRPWSAPVQAAFADPTLPADAAAEARDARQAFLVSNVSCGIDVFMGGGSYDHVREAAAGRLVRAAVFDRHPEWFRDDVIPQRFAGEEFWDRDGRWVGNVLSNYGILFNRDALHRLGITSVPAQWRDLANPRYRGEIALADPTKSSSMAKAFENLIQQQMQQALEEAKQSGADPAAAEPAAVRAGWMAGLRLIQLIGANARYFTDSAQKIPIDVAQGDCAAGICIDFYGRAQTEATARRGAVGRVGFVTPRGGTVSSVDPVSLLRGAPHRAAADAFIEYTLTLDAQRLWNLRPATPGGPAEFALRRLPVRRDFYAHPEWKPLRSDPDSDPFTESGQLIYQPRWTAHLFREMELIERVMVQDTHEDLVRAWTAIQQAPAERRGPALARMQDLGPVSYDRVIREIAPALAARDPLQELRVARELAAFFRANYAAAAACAGE